jgi:hypothetical protein
MNERKTAKKEEETKKKINRGKCGLGSQAMWDFEW